MSIKLANLIEAIFISNKFIEYYLIKCNQCFVTMKIEKNNRKTISMRITVVLTFFRGFAEHIGSSVSNISSGGF